MRYRLHPAVSALFEDFPFQPEYVLESRWRQFLVRGAAGLVVIVAAYAPILTSRLLWEDSSAGAADVWRHSSAGLAWVWSSPLARPTYITIRLPIRWPGLSSSSGSL